MASRKHHPLTIIVSIPGALLLRCMQVHALHVAMILQCHDTCACTPVSSSTLETEGSDMVWLYIMFWVHNLIWHQPVPDKATIMQPDQ